MAMFAAVYIPDFSAEALLRARSELRHTALAVLEGAPPQSYVISANEKARRLGVTVGMTRMQAERLLADDQQQMLRSAQHDNLKTKTTIAQRSLAAERSAHAALLDAVYAISPRVEDTAMDAVVLDVAGLERLFGTPQQIARELASRVASQGLEANLAIAATPYTAEHAARGFAGATVIAPSTEAARLGALPLEVLFSAEAAECARDAGLTHEEQRKRQDRIVRMQQTLDRWGIRSFRALAALPAVSLSERLGRYGVRLQQLANGTLMRELALADPPLTFEESIELENPVENLESLLFLLSRLLEQACARLSARALCANELRLRMKLERVAPDDASLTNEELSALGAGVVERKLTLPVAMNDARLFLKLWHLQMSSRPPGAPVTQMWLTAEAARPRVAQPGLFVPLAPEPEKLELTLARVHKLLGSAVSDGELRAGCAEVLDSHRPDAFRMVRFRTREDVEASSDGAVSAASPRMALRRVRPAAPAMVELRDGIPVRVECESVMCELSQDWSRSGDNVVWAAGPWRSSGSWWDEGQQEQRQPQAPLRQAQGRLSTPLCSAQDDLRVEVTSSPALPWRQEEWDVAVAVTVQQRAWRDEDGRRMGGRRTRATHVSLYRIHRDVDGGSWFIDGSYD
jgi:protein ImuB